MCLDARCVCERISLMHMHFKFLKICSFCHVALVDMPLRYDSGYLTCSKKLTGSQLSLPHGINRKLKCETKK